MAARCAPWGHRTAHPTVARLKKVMRPSRLGAFFRGPGRYKPSIRRCPKGPALMFLAKSHGTTSAVPPRNGISPAAVVGWAVARFKAEGHGKAEAEGHAAQAAL